MKSVTVIVAIVVAAGPAWADMHGGDLYAACTSAAGSPGEKYCQAYINGLVDGAQAVELQAEQKTPICTPEHTSTAQVRDILVRFFAANQLAMNFPAGSAVAVAMRQAWPCKSN